MLHKFEYDMKFANLIVVKRATVKLTWRVKGIGHVHVLETVQNISISLYEVISKRQNGQNGLNVSIQCQK